MTQNQNLYLKKKNLTSVSKLRELRDQFFGLMSGVFGRLAFNPRSRHIKDFKNGTWYRHA